MNIKDMYTDEGWIDAEKVINCKEPFAVAIGGRGIGKTYGILKTLYEKHIPFIYMRRTQTQLDAVTIQPLNPYNQICRDTGVNIISQKISKHTVGFYNAGVNEKGAAVAEGDPFALGISLSTFSNIRSLSAENYEVLFFDEIIPERHERPIKEEGLAFANVLESIGRNRELQNKPPLKVILATNSNTINGKILEALGCIDIIDSMARKGQFFKSVNGLIAIFRYIDSPISERKKNSALYQIVKNDDFQGMAINNAFSQSDYENVKVKPLAEYNPLCSYGNSTVYKHKSKREYYCTTGVKAEHYDKLPLSTKAFQRKFFYLYGAILDKRVYYQTASVKIEIEGAFKNG